MIPGQLETLTVKQLADFARKSGIRGWHDMRKAELISAIKKIIKKTAITKPKSQTANKPIKKGGRTQTVPPRQQKKATAIQLNSATTATTASKKKKSPQKSESVVTSTKTSASRLVAGKTASAVKSQIVSQKTHTPAKKSDTKPKTLPTTKPKNKPKYVPIVVVEDHDGPTSHRFNLKENLINSRELGGVFEGDHIDRLVLVACDPFWLQAIWELNIKLVNRAKAAMGVDWHAAVPILRLYKIISDGISKQHRVHVRDVYPRGHVNNWYLDVQDAPACFLVEIGYFSSKGRFFPLASSNMVETPDGNGFGGTGSTGSCRTDMVHGSERFFSFRNVSNPERYERKERSEDQTRRAVPAPLFARFGDGPIESVKVEFEVDVVLYGKTLPDAQLTIKNEPVRLQSDGKFTFRFQLPEKRQVYPIVAVSSDGIESQTTILAIERNTKALETVFREPDEIE